MKEEKFPHTRKPLHWWRQEVGGDEALEPRRRTQQQGCREQSGEISPQRISADQHSPAGEACLLTCWGGWRLGAEARASEVRSQGEDWGWLCEQSLKRASTPQLLGGSLGKCLELPKKQKAIVLGYTRRGDSLPVCPQKTEHCLNELQIWVQAMVTSLDPRDGDEPLMLLLQPPRILCASTGHYPHNHPQEPAEPTNARVPWSRDNFPERANGVPQAQAHPAFQL